MSSFFDGIRRFIAKWKENRRVEAARREEHRQIQAEIRRKQEQRKNEERRRQAEARHREEERKRQLYRKGNEFEDYVRGMSPRTGSP